MLFVVLLAIGLAMVPATPPSYEGPAWFVVAASAFWAALFGLEDLLTPVPSLGPDDGAQPPEAPGADALFAPPPSPRVGSAERRREP
jgi:hypothetical protein